MLNPKLTCPRCKNPVSEDTEFTFTAVVEDGRVRTRPVHLQCPGKFKTAQSKAENS